MLKNATMVGGTMTDHLVKVRVITDLPNELEERNLLLTRGVGRWDDDGVNVACCFGTSLLSVNEKVVKACI